MPARFYVLVTLLTLVDNVVVTGVIWLSLKLTGSVLMLGVVLGLSVAIPFLLERRFGQRITRMAPRQLMLVRAVAFIASLATAASGLAAGIEGFLLVALLVGIVDYFTVTVLESQNARFVVAGKASAEQAAKWIQTAIQLGSFGGAMLGGLLLANMDGLHFLVWVSAAGLMACPAILFMPAVQAAPPDEAEGEQPGPTRRVGTSRLAVGRNLGTMWLGCIALFGLHIGAFNSMVPVVFQTLRSWDAGVYGLASGLAGLGAFAAAALPNLRLRPAVACALFAAGDVVLVTAASPALAAGAAFMVGYLFNHLRIGVRERLLASARSEADADWIGSRSAYANLSMQSIGPLAFATLTTGALFGPAAAPVLLVITGMALAGTTFAAATAWSRTAPATGAP